MKKILMIDDEKDFCFFMKKNIEAGLPGFSVISANNGPDGITAAMHEKPDIILLDIVMPKMDGFEVIKILKEKMETTSIPVIMLTAVNTDEAKATSLGLYHEDYIIKPVKSDLLISKIKDVLSRKA